MQHGRASGCSRQTVKNRHKIEKEKATSAGSSPARPRKSLKGLARRTGRFPQLVDPRSSVNGLLLTGSPRFREVSLEERRSLCGSSSLRLAHPPAGWPRQLRLDQLFGGPPHTPRFPNRQRIFSTSATRIPSGDGDNGADSCSRTAPARQPVRHRGRGAGQRHHRCLRRQT
jgi:hypothetical protein